MLANDDDTALRIKHLLIEKLNIEGLTPDNIDDEMTLFGDGLGLDSVDALELVVALEKAFDIRIQSHEIGREAFASVATLAEYVDGRVANTSSIHADS